MRRIYEDTAYGPLPDAGNFWRAGTAPPEDDGPAEGEVRCEFAIVGAGFTGLNAALELAEAGADAVVLEAEAPGWGASGRNGGFACLGGDMLGAEALHRRHGPEELATYRKAQRAAVDLVAEMLDTHGIDADRHSKGETQLAHRARDAARFPEAAQALRAAHGLNAEILPREALADHGMAGPGFHGAMTVPVGFALNPLKYALGLLGAARGAGVRVHSRSPVERIAEEDGHWCLSTPRGRVRARSILVATNGYSSEDVPRWLRARYLPVQSNILVTRPLTREEREAQGFTTAQMCYDTRRLLHYFRLLPDGRMLFGMRGATKATEHAMAATRARARADFEAMFPAWRQVETPHFWSGLLCLTRRLTPFAGPLGDMPRAWGAMGYHGNGVAMGGYAGRLMAEQALGRAPRRPCPAFMRAPPRRFELGGWRRAALGPAYGFYDFLDGGRG